MGTKIEWTDEVWNPVTGCTRVSQGCKNCYAERVSHRFGRDFTKIELHPEKLDLPRHWRKPRRVFVNSMSDLFHENVPVDFLNSVFVTMLAAPQHTFQILTKRPDRARKYLCSPTMFGPRIMLPNVWLGVSVEDQATADQRIPILLDTPAALRFVSYEPALGLLDLSPYIIEDVVKNDGRRGPALDWIIAGGESGPHARPAHPDWFRSVRDQCQEAAVPFFFKQNGEFLPCGPDVEDEDFSDGRSFGLALGGRASTRVLRANPSRFVKIGAQVMERVGKKRAGRLLDGREWNEFPKEEAR